MTTAPEALTQEETLATLGRYDFGWADPDAAGATARRGLSADVVADISALKSEPQWMLDFRLKALDMFGKKPMPRWGSDLSGIDFDNIKYFVRSSEKQAATWDDLPADIKNTYDKLGIPEAEKARLVSGVAAEFPQLCEAEAEVFAELLGTHVQRLATIARGDAACTTHVPAQQSPADRSSGTTTAVTTGGDPDVKGRQVV